MKINNLKVEQTGKDISISQEYGSVKSDLSDFQRGDCSEDGAFLRRLSALAGVQTRDGQQERRRDPRIVVGSEARIMPFNPLLLHHMDVRVLDISTHGLKLELPERLEPATLVQIRLKGLMIMAEIRYCIPVGERFQAGVMIQDIFPKTSITADCL